MSLTEAYMIRLFAHNVMGTFTMRQFAYAFREPLTENQEENLKTLKELIVRMCDAHRDPQGRIYFTLKSEFAKQRNFPVLSSV